jgi:hypothetical protein
MKITKDFLIGVFVTLTACTVFHITIVSNHLATIAYYEAKSKPNFGNEFSVPEDSVLVGGDIEKARRE